MRFSKDIQRKQPIQVKLNFPEKEPAESGRRRRELSMSTANHRETSQTEQEVRDLMEEILERNNLNKAYVKVKQNGGTAGVDGMTVGEAGGYLKEHGVELIRTIREGKYVPQPVRRAEIEKTEGGKRELGIPTVIDRIIQQAMLQVLSPIWEEEFSDNSYGFRAGKSAHDAVRESKEIISQGYGIVVDIDLEKFFDRVNHDKLMHLVSIKVKDKRVLKLIRKYLESGVMIGGLTKRTEEGTPQGGPISPLLSNIMLNELDKELEKRGHKFCRYADDCNIYVRSRRAGDRVMKSVTRFIEGKLKLKVNQEKSAVDKPENRKFLGFYFYRKKEGGVSILVHWKSWKKFKDKVREQTGRSNGRTLEYRITKLNELIRGWVYYFRWGLWEKLCKDIDGWIRRRLRMCMWKNWKGIKGRSQNLVKLGMCKQDALMYAFLRRGYWYMANCKHFRNVASSEYFRRIGFIGAREYFL